MNKKIILLSAVAGISVILYLMIYMPEWFRSSDSLQSNGAKKQDHTIAVNGLVVLPERIDNKIVTTGSVIPNEHVELRSEISGRITGIFFQEDSPVRKGQLLVKINDQDLKAQKNKILIQKQLAEQDEKRKKSILTIEGISLEEYERSLSLLHSLEAELELLDAQIAKTEIRAPFDGVIGLRKISPGGFVSPNDLIADMQEIDPVKIEFMIPEKYSHLIRKGSKIHFKTIGSENTHSGTVYALSSSIDVTTRSLAVRAKASNKERTLKPGAFVKVEFILNSVDDAVVVPSEAVVPELGGQKVYVYQNGKAIGRQVFAGIRTDSETQLINGVNIQDTIIITGLLQLKDSMNVRIDRIIDKPMLKVSSLTN